MNRINHRAWRTTEKVLADWRRGWPLQIAITAAEHGISPRALCQHEQPVAVDASLRLPPRRDTQMKEGDYAMTYTEIAVKLGVSQVRAQQLCHSALRKIFKQEKPVLRQMLINAGELDRMRRPVTLPDWA